MAVRVVTLTATALAGLLVSGLLTVDRDADAVIPSQHRLPAASVVHQLHPYGRTGLCGTADPLARRRVHGEMTAVGQDEPGSPGR